MIFPRQTNSCGLAIVLPSKSFEYSQTRAAHRQVSSSKRHRQASAFLVTMELRLALCSTLQRDPNHHCRNCSLTSTFVPFVALTLEVQLAPVDHCLWLFHPALYALASPTVRLE